MVCKLPSRVHVSMVHMTVKPTNQDFRRHPSEVVLLTPGAYNASGPLIPNKFNQYSPMMIPSWRNRPVSYSRLALVSAGDLGREVGILLSCLAVSC